MSKRKFDQLPPTQKAAIQKAAKTAALAQRRINAANEEKALEVLKGKGLTVNALTQHAAFRQKVLPMYEKLRTSIGSDLLNAALAEVK